MPFTKGNIPWNKGKKMPKGFSENLRKNFSGKNHPFYGKKHSIISKTMMSFSRKGKNIACNNSNWKGGKKNIDGYIWIYSPNHPKAYNGIYVFEHRLIMEKHLKRFLNDSEVVHHVNGIKDDNRLFNLKLFPSQRAHTIFHLKKRGLTNG